MLSAGTKSDLTPVEFAPPPVDPDTVWRHVVEPVDHFLKNVAKQLVAQVDAFDPEVAPYAHYALTSQGKQLRPALLGLSASIFQNPGQPVVTAAVIIEMIHLATLVHDDIMDEAALRRSRPTLAANWGNQISVLLGDSLFAHALKLAAGYPTTEVCRAVSGATKTVCSGEILQTLRRSQKTTSREDYFRILAMKTAELFALSCELGASLSGASTAECQALKDFGLNLGIAYQVYDDCLDLFATESATGKTVGGDLASGKVTLPLLVALERSAPPQRERTLHLIQNWEPSHLAELLQILANTDALPEAQNTVQELLHTARCAIENLPDCPSLDALNHLTHFLAQQTSQIGS